MPTYYKKSYTFSKKKIIKVAAILLSLSGATLTLFISFPILSWQFYFQPVFASQNITVPIPQTTVISSFDFDDLVHNAASSVATDYSDAKNWFPELKFENKTTTPSVSQFILSIPKIEVKHAIVSTIDYDVAKHLINYPGTALPGEMGTSVIFGHSTLPQLFNPKDYKTIFAHAYKLSLGDKIYATVSDTTYTYKIFSITVVDPTDTSLLAQSFDSSYITLVTCTPPGTTWKRLIVKARLETI